MRFVFVGAGEITQLTVKALTAEGHDVVVVESDRERIDDLEDRLDCSFVHGDGSRPEILREAGVGDTDILFCLTNDDRVNIIASVVGRYLGFARVVTSVEDPELESVCRGLELQDVVVPARTTAMRMLDIVRGSVDAEMSIPLRNGARLFSFEIAPKVKRPADLELPDDVVPLWLYRGDAFRVVDGDTELRAGDELVVLCRGDRISELAGRFRRNGEAKEP